MSMINISGIPNMGFAGGGGGYFAPSGLGQLGIGDISAYNKAPGIGADQALYNNIFNNFGQQTDYYSALGAAYGRGTGGFGTPGSNPGWQDPGAGGGYDGGSQAVPPGYHMDTRFGTPGGMGSVFDQGAGSLGSMDMFGGYQPGMQPGMQDFSQLWGGRIAPQAPPVAQPVEDVNSWFNQLYGGGGGNPYPLGGYGGFDPFGGGGQQAIPPGYHMDTRFGAPGGMPSSQALLGYDPSFSAQFAPGGGSDFAARFGQWGLNPGQPSQYYTGSAYPWANTGMLPPGFAPPFSADEPKGALPFRGFEGTGI